MDSARFEQRMTVLEEKVEYQEYTIEKLNEVILGQQRQLDKMEDDLKRVQEKVFVNYVDTVEDVEKEERPPQT